MKHIDNYKPMTMEESEAFVRECGRKADDGTWSDRNDFESYSPEVVALIDEYVATGKYPYNRDIERLARERLFTFVPEPTKEILEEYSQQDPYLSLIVYNSQCYRHARDEREQARKTAERLTAEGFQQLTDKTLPTLEAGKRYYVFPRFRIGSERYTFLRPTNDRSGVWVTRFGAHSGWTVQPGQWIKAAS